MVKSKIKSNPKAVTRFLAGIAIILISINIIVQFLIYTFQLNKHWFLLFNMDKEVNIPTVFSCSLLLICSYLISLIYNRHREQRDKIEHKWNVLKWIFIFLALDEGLQIHEALIIPSLKPMLPTMLSIIWVIPYGIFAIYAAIYFIPLIKSLPRKLKYLTLLSGIIYITGALIIEMIGNYFVRVGDIRLHGISYGLISTLEESLEIFGLIIFIYTLLRYAFGYQNQKLKITFRLSSEKGSNHRKLIKGEN